MKPKMTLLNPQLEVFIAVAKNKSMHGAAKAIHLSQTAITQRVRSLEARLKTTLFIRTKQGVYLTPDGEALLRYCNATLNLEGEALATIRGSGTSSTVRVCITGPTSIMSSRIIPKCALIMKKFPELMLTFDINDSEQRIKSLQIGTSQLAIIEPAYTLKEMEIKPLAPEKYQLVCTSQWKKRSLDNIIRTERIIDFSEADPMTLNYLNQYKFSQLAKAERHFVNQNEPLTKLLIDGYGYGVLTNEVSKSYVDSNQLIILNSGKSFTNRLVLAWYNRPESPKYFSELIQAIQ